MNLIHGNNAGTGFKGSRINFPATQGATPCAANVSPFQTNWLLILSAQPMSAEHSRKLGAEKVVI